MSTVTIYRNYCYTAPQMDATGEHYDVEPFGEDTIYIKGETLDHDEYVLPQGYYVAESESGRKRIYYDGEGIRHACCLCIGRHGLPVLEDHYGGYITLRRADATETAIAQ